MNMCMVRRKKMLEEEEGNYDHMYKKENEDKEQKYDREKKED